MADSSTASTIMDEQNREIDSEKAYEHAGPAVEDESVLERIGSQNKETMANMFPEGEAEAEADLERAGRIPVVPQKGGVNPADFPDGGFEAWSVVVGGWCCLFVSFGWINCIGIFQEYYQENLLTQYSSSTVSWIPSMEVFFMFFWGPVFGKIFDNYGPRWLLLGGTLGHVFGLMMTSLSKQYYQIFLAQGMCSAIGASAIFYSAVSSVGTWFYKHRAAALGVMASGSSMGGVVIPIMVTKLIPKIGFRLTMVTSAFMILGMCIIANLTVKSRLPVRPGRMNIMDTIRPLGEPAFLLITIGSFFFFFGTFLPFNYVILQAQASGMSINLSQYLTSMLNAASIFGRILPGIVADRWGRFNTMIITTALSAILVLALWIPSNSNAPIIVFSILFGFTSGAFVTMGPALIAQISPIREIGVRSGTMFAIISFSGLFGSPIGGALVDRNHGDFLYLQLFCGIAMTIGIRAHHSQVVARIRPLLNKELDKDIIVRGESSKDGGPMNIVRIPNPKNEAEEFSFTFNGVYPIETTQEVLFTNEVAPHLKSLFQGLDVTIFAYGVTGTGKTHTMRGGLKLTERGVIPRLLSGIYRRGRKVVKDSNGETSVLVTLSYYEIYNDKVFDLFEPPEKRSQSGLPLREKDGKTIVVGLSEHACDDLKDFERLYIEANNNRSTAGTKLNAQSSRSHAILMVKVTQTTGDKELISTASAIDLAGSEDNRRTENNKDRMVESASINKSLFVLSQCIDAIGRGDKRIPYRESKMTRILSLGQNNGITIMILNLAPLRSYHLDTLSSLNVSSRAKRIEVREIENEVVFKQPPRNTSFLAGPNMLRQPLRPLANAHNTQINGASKKSEKPLKAFSVYTESATSHVVRRTNSTKKRPSDSTVNSRPSKMVRTGVLGPKYPSSNELSAAKIEEMVERKVSEMLANRVLDQPPAVPRVDISEEVQRRLEALEKKIENESSDDSRSEGLRFLLMAKQHKERGEYQSALKMYELALPYFPGQEKLLRKIEGLRAKILAKKDEEGMRPLAAVTNVLKPTAATLVPQATRSEFSPKDTQFMKLNKVQADTMSDDEYNEAEIADENENFEDDSFSYKAPKSKKSKHSKSATKSALHIFADDADDEPPTPRTQHLLEIINSRDVALIKGLSGVGSKKARDLVEFLELRSEDEGGMIRSLKQLRAVPGLGGRTVERAYEGIAISK
ncbi:hypothetical protein B7463_g7956, partial [Scytalidium lignicola]